MEQERPYDLLAISDLHLGCDLRGGTPLGGPHDEPTRDGADGDAAGAREELLA